MTSITISAIAIVIAVALFFFMSMKGFGLISISIIATILVGLTVEGGLIYSIFDVFAGGCGGYMGQVVFAFMTGGIYGGVLSASGCSERFGRSVINKFGIRFAPYGLMVFTMVLAYVGVTSFPFLGAILAFSLLKAANLPRNVAAIVMTGASTYAIFCMPGSIAVPNMLPTPALGTTLYAGAGMGLLLFAVGCIMLVFYVERLCKKYRAEGIGYTPCDMEKMAGSLTDEEDLPSFIVSVIPMVVVIAGAMIFQLVMGLEAYAACAFAQIIGVLVVIVLNWNRLKEKARPIAEGATAASMPLVQVSMVFGFAAVVAATPAYGAMMGSVMALNINPYLLCVIATAVLACLAADAGAGVAMFSNMLGPKCIAMGANPGLLHRLTTATATTLDTMPYASNVCVTMSFLGLTHKEAYLQIVVVCVGITSVYTGIGLGYCLLFG